MAGSDISQEFLCIRCPGKGNETVDIDVMGHCTRRTADSFLQTRRYGIDDPDNYSSDEALAKLSADALLYCDPDTGEMFEDTGDYDAALLGAKCARAVLSGLCAQDRDEVLFKSEID